MMVGIVLAGGASTRMGASKPLVREQGQSFLARGIRRLWSGCDVVIVVLGSGARAVQQAVEREFETLIQSGALHRDLQGAHRHGAKGLEVRFVTNPRWRAGMLGSVRLGLGEALRSNPDGILVMPVDQPNVQPETVGGVVALLGMARAACRTPRERSRFRYALIPRHDRRRGHPVALTAALARDVIDDAGAADLSDAVRRNARLVGYLDVEDAGIVENRNTPRAAKGRAAESATRRAARAKGARR